MGYEDGEECCRKFRYVNEKLGGCLKRICNYSEPQRWKARKWRRSLRRKCKSVFEKKKDIWKDKKERSRTQRRERLK
jgi:hypothetical protein